MAGPASVALGMWLAMGGAKAGAAAETPKVVDATEVVKDLVVDMKYATPDNFLKQKVYPDGARCMLLPDAAARLAKAADTLRAQGYRLKVYDCYRPIAVQWQMWKIFPKPGYVANPKKGGNHNRGAAVDLTLTTMEGQEVEMPTEFDSFEPKAHHGYAGGTEASRKHREILRAAMEGAGFKKNLMEWWHYDLPGATKLPVLDVPFTKPEQTETPPPRPRPSDEQK